MQNITKATTLDDIYNAFDVAPLQLDELAEFYEKSLAAARSKTKPRTRIERRLRTTKTFCHILLVGYKGCGKSTELKQLEQDIQNDFLVLNFSVMQELDPAHLNYIELFILTMERLFNYAEKEHLNIDEKLLKRIQRWTDTKEIEEIKEKYMSAQFEAGAEVEVGIPYLQKFFAKLTASAKSSRSLKEVLKTNVEPKLSELIDLCNSLIMEVRLQLRTRGKKDLVIIIEDLDKIPLDRAKSLFVNYTVQLVSLRANVIYTFPIALYYSTDFTFIKANFDEIHELYMVKVYERDGRYATAGIQALTDLVAARMQLDLFESPDLLRTMILKSGGCLRDLFFLIKEAAEAAIDDDAAMIGRAQYNLAYQKLKAEYENTIADYTDDKGKVLKAEVFMEALTTLAKSELKKVENTDIFLRLRQNLTVLGYNSENWMDVHPVVKDILEERKLL